MRRRAAILAALALMFGWGRAASCDDERTFESAIEVTTVNVDVYVRDKEGKPVTGLTAEDFEVSEDGQPMAITHFFALEGAVTADREPKREARPRQAYTLPAEQRLLVVIWVDDLSITPFNRNRVLKGVQEFIRSDIPDDAAVSVLAFNRRLQTMLRPTLNRRALERTIEDLGTTTGGGVMVAAERTRVLSDIRTLAMREDESPADVDAAMATARAYAQAVAADAKRTVGALEATVSALAGVPGRKVVLYVGEGFPDRPGTEAFVAVDKAFNYPAAMHEQRDFHIEGEIERLALHANAARVSFFMLDASGVTTDRLSGADTGDLSVPFRSAGPGSQGTSLETILRFSFQTPFRHLASATGGRAFLNSNEVRTALKEAAMDFTSFYSLGYTPPHSGDDEDHTIKVIVKRSDVTVRHREGYRDRSWYQLMVDRTMAALDFPPGEDAMSMELYVDPRGIEEKRRKRHLVPFVLHVPMDRLTLIPGEGGYVSRVSLFLVAQDDQERTSEVKELDRTIRVPENRMHVTEDATFQLDFALELRGTSHRVAVGLREHLTGETGFLCRLVNLDTLVVEEAE